MTFCHNSICWVLRPWPDNHNLIHHNRLGRYLNLSAIPYHLCYLRFEIEEFPDCCRTPLLDYLFHVFPKEDKSYYDGRNIKVDILFLNRENAREENYKRTVKIGCGRAEGNEEIHICYTFFDSMICSNKKSFSSKNHNRRGDNEEPYPCGKPRKKRKRYPRAN